MVKKNKYEIKDDDLEDIVRHATVDMMVRTGNSCMRSVHGHLPAASLAGRRPRAHATGTQRGRRGRRQQQQEEQPADLRAAAA